MKLHGCINEVKEQRPKIDMTKIAEGLPYVDKLV